MDKNAFSDRFLQRQPQTKHGGNGPGQGIAGAGCRHAGVAAEIDENPAVRRADQGMSAFHDQQGASLPGGLLQGDNPVAADLRQGLPGQVCQFTQVRGQDGGPWSFPQQSKISGNGRKSVAIEQQGLLDGGDQFFYQLLRLRGKRQAGAEDHQVALFRLFQQLLQIGQRNTSGSRFLLWQYDDFTAFLGNKGRYRAGRGQIGIAAASLQKRQGGEVRRAVIIGGAGNKQRLPHAAFMGLGRAGGQFYRAIDLDLEADIVIERRGKRNVRDRQLAALAESRVQHVADLGQTEGNRVVRPDGDAHDGPRVAVNAGRDVQAENRFAALINQLDQIPVKTAHLPIQPGAEERIHQYAAVHQFASYGLSRLNLPDLHGKLAENFEITGCRALEFSLLTGQQDRNQSADSVETACHHETIAAVVAGAAKHGAPLSSYLHRAGQDSAGRESSIFHEDLFRDEKPFHRLAIHSPHLGNTRNLHGTPRFLIT